MKPNSIFKDKRGRSRCLIGTAVNTGNPRLAELAGRMGFDAVWIELEHASSDPVRAEELCVWTERGGAVPVIRTAGSHRDHLLQALEVGGRIVVIPMVNDAATAQDIVRFGKFRPLGERGYNTRSRAAGYGLSPLPMTQMNAATHLLPQIETLEAVRNLDAILAVKGLGGIFVGPGDLSCDLGCPGNMDDPRLRRMVVACVRRARAVGLHAGILVGEGRLLDAAMQAGADLCIVSSDMGTLIKGWREQLKRHDRGAS